MVVEREIRLVLRTLFVMATWFEIHPAEAPHRAKDGCEPVACCGTLDIDHATAIRLSPINRSTTTFTVAIHMIFGHLIGFYLFWFLNSSCQFLDFFAALASLAVERFESSACS